MTIEDQYSTSVLTTASHKNNHTNTTSNNLSAVITNINYNGHQQRTSFENRSVNSSISSSSSSCSIIQQNNAANTTLKNSCSNSLSKLTLSEAELAKDDPDTIFVRVSITDQNIQKVLRFGLTELVAHAKQRVLSTLNKEIKDGLNYGLYQPPFQGRAGKFLDDCRMLKEYSLQGPVANLEFKYKKRVYKFIKINQKELKALNVKSNFKRFLDLVRTNQTSKVNRLLEKGLDPNFHSDLGETPLTIAASLADPRSMIMTLYNGGAHLDFRSRDTLTPMHKAATIGNDKALKTLLELGAFAEVRDGRSLTPLFYSIMNGSSVQAIEYLLFNGSSIGVRDDNNWQEIHHACKLGLSQHLDHLIYYGCDINAKNNSGNTPLHVCAIHNQENCARILLFRGCSRTERNLANQTAFESGVIAGNQLIADLIKNHRECDVVPIRDRPFYNTKRRSIYSAAVTDFQSSYSINSNGSTNSSISSRIPSSSNKSTMSSLKTTDTLVDWNSNNPTASTSSLSSSATALRSRSMPKLIDEVQAASDGGSSSPTSRSRSISSDDHGFGSASLSQMSSGGSPNNHSEYVGHRKRLYSSIPQRTYVCVKAFRASQAGELELKRNDLIEVFNIGESGYWEGRCLNTGCEGWFKSECLEEVDEKERIKLDMMMKRRHFMELIQSCDLSALRTVVLQRGRKGFGFVLRGAKTNDIKFEPTPEVPALQFLESVDRDSNADKAGLKPLDFVLEINNVDVTCRTHAECVKLIKKTGDTLALKVYTVNNSNPNNLIQTNLASSNLASIYHAPQMLMSRNSKHFTSSHVNLSSTSYYATTPLNHHYTLQQRSATFDAEDEVGARLAYTQAVVMDGTKSLPHKKKPIVPIRSPCTSLTNPASTKNSPPSHTFSSSSNSSYSPYSSPASVSPNSPPKHVPSSLGSVLSRIAKSPTKNLLGRSKRSEQAVLPSGPSSTSSGDNTSYMNIVLAQIDELDKTIAQYDENDRSSDLNSSNMSYSSQRYTLETTPDNSSKKKLLANDANAASIRTRVPVRKPGINNGEIFKHPAMGLTQKTASVPNLYHQSNQSPVSPCRGNHMVPLPPPPVPPPPPPGQNIYAAPSIRLKPTSCGVQNSASSDTLVQEESDIDHGTSAVHECQPDYDLNDDTINSYMEPPADYDQLQQQKSKLTTFNQTRPVIGLSNNVNSNISPSNLIMMINNTNSSTNQKSPSIQSPLTPRQLKQRNTAKRNSVPCRSSSSTPTINDPSTTTLTQQQLSDLQFLQSQKFDTDFIQTTNDLFTRYPHAKISISVTVSSYQTATNGTKQLQTNQTTRQIEIDKQMFDKIVQFQNVAFPPKIQPQTPIRTTSTLTPATASTTTASGLKYSSFSSSSSPSSSSSASSYSSSNYDSAICMEKSTSGVEDLHEAIKRVANEHILKRQLQQQSSTIKEEVQTPSIDPSKSTAKFGNPRKLSTNSSGSGSSSDFSGKSELELAIENRFKRQSQSAESSTVVEAACVQSTKLSPPPAPPLPQVFKVPGSPPLPSPPSPLALQRINSTEQQRPNCPPPPPPIAPFLNGTATISKQPQTVKQMISNANNNNVSGIQQASFKLSAQDPRSSSDFSALIAKKAAEKRAAFTELPKPSVNAVTFQGGEVCNSTEQNVVKIQVEKPKIVSKPAISVCQPAVANIIKQNNFNKVTVGPLAGNNDSCYAIGSGVKAKVEKFQTPLSPPPPPDNELPVKFSLVTKPLTIQTKTTVEASKQEIMENKANESFMHTAQKLLEKAKQAQINRPITTTTTTTTVGQEDKLIVKPKVASKSVQQNLEKSIMNETNAKAN